MVNRNNYAQSKEYFSFLEEVCQRRPKTLQRYWDYQKDLLIWADEVPFGHIDVDFPVPGGIIDFFAPNHSVFLPAANRGLKSNGSGRCPFAPWAPATKAQA